MVLADQAQSLIAELRGERDEAQAGAYRSGLDAVDRLAELDKANERANKNWRDFRDLRLAIIGDGPMCRDCADFDGCQGNGRPCDPDEAVKEQIAVWKTAEAEVKRLTELADRLKLEAQGHASETRTANSTIYEIYQVLSGGKGEPGNWNGAEPARRYVEAAEAERDELRKALEALRDGPGIECVPDNDVQDMIRQALSGSNE
ncbi:hypothetical protein [Devosia sp. Naph2]|uniref:hypothetical protein n=1 Tax=Devosia polycyclovorans TaxID=3345148 RepID=UPI0035CEA734